MEKNDEIQADDLTMALGAVDRAQLSIRRADTKAAGLAGFQLSVLTIALGQTEAAARVWSSGTRSAAIVLAVMLVLGLAGSLALLGAVIWPRISGDHAGNVFAFPALAALAEPPRSREHTGPEDAWRLAMDLSGTARRKYELVRIAMCAMVVSVSGIVGWLCLASTAQ
ncbi:Pycsar system effector family protein [Actinoplanes friuliensis]|uniref:Pycsar effector protein domain-containing protein n=1 Tax=Actinoplanes friuliensis DSM 7358 TaxID=1246995 RepID=U5W519_9ACTN|nr:Pycsar system effector family protein [Actinoplanes friuliensis]AGZ44313.1 hypothetical protein AFR_30265 [Actinoplanes friuliensis DSM 7358]